MAGIALAIGAGVSAVAGLAGAAMSANAAENAANTQAAAADRQAQIQKEMFEKQIELNEPFRQGGLAAQNRLLTYLGLPGGDANSADYGMYNRDFSMRDYQADPGYAFRLSEGTKAIERSAAARGGLLSGATLKGITRYGQDFASNEYQNAYNRFQANRTARMNPLQAFLGQGQTATNVMSNAAGQAGQGIAQAYGNAGQARASGYIGQANAINQGVGSISNAVNSYMGYNMMNRMMHAVTNNFTPTASPTSYGGAGYMGAGPFMP